MFNDDTWTDNEDEGFRFDWDQSDLLDQRLTANTVRFKNITLSADKIDLSDLEGPVCAVCHSVIRNNVFYESKVTFCSEKCWENVIYSAIDDFALGGLSAWPLEMFTSTLAKSFLINLACKSSDGNLIVKLLRYLQSSLSPKVFESLLLEHTIAFNHFTNFLRKIGQNQLLYDLLMARESVEAAKTQSYCELIQNMDSLNKQEAERLSHRLRVFALTELSVDPRLNLLRETTDQLSELLQFQCQHESEWTQFYPSLVNQNTGTDSHTNASPTLLALPLSETIRTFAWMDKKVGIGSRAHELHIHYKVHNDQFRWLVMEPLVLNSNWVELDSILLEKKWLKRQMRTLLPNDRILLYLHALNAPPGILTKYLSYSDDPEEMMELAIRFRMFSTALECCLKKRDMAAMKQLLSRIPTKEPEYLQVSHYLSVPVNQWKERRK